MEEVRRAAGRYFDLNGNAHELEYRLLVERGEPCRYGVEIRDMGGGRSLVRDITSRAERGEEILELLVRNTVTPVALRDVIDDLL